MSENSFNNQIISKEQISSIFIEKTKLINSLLSQDEKIKKEYLINQEDKKIFKFLLLFFRKTKKLYDIKVILRHKKISKHLEFHKDLEKFYPKINLILSKFYLICIFNSSELCKLFKYKNENFSKKIFHLIKAHYLHNLIGKENLVNIIRLKLYNCFYEEKYISHISEFDKKKIYNKKIENLSPLEEIINFLLSFTEEKMSQKKIIDFNYIINSSSDLIKKLFLFNYNNIALLSNSLLFYRLIELSKLSAESIDRIFPLLKSVYKNSFNLDFYLNDLNEMFILKKDENIARKNNSIITKNKFLEELFGCEREKNLIKNGFVFNDDPNNGLIFYANDSFTFPKDSFSMVISFKLLESSKMEKENNKFRKYCIFSISEREKFENTKFAVFIENKILKIFYDGNTQELFKEKIIYNNLYVLWIFSEGTKKNNKTIFYLNDQKIEKNINYVFPQIIYSINLGFQNDKQQNNFEGIIGTFILFNKCFIKNNNNPNDIKANTFFEDIFLKLNSNYEDIIYINYSTEYSLLNIETQEILNKLNSDNISRFIEAIISSKSVVNNNFCCSHKIRKEYKANYFCFKSEEQQKATIRFKTEKIIPFLNNYNLNSRNCLITYPICLKNSFNDFINNNGIKFLEMELYYFIGVIEYYNNNKKYGENYLKKNSKLFSENIQIILKLFLYCLSELNPKQEKENKENIEQFFYTLNNLINLKSKTDFKIEYKFLIAISGYIHLLLKNINFCGFILDCQYYDLNDDKTLELLFQTILVDFEKHYSELFSKEIFTKILNFDKIFTQNNLKQCRKPYSVLIQNILNKIINENKIDCFIIYIQKINDLQIKNTPSNYLYDNIDEEDIREEENENNILANNRKKLSLISNSSCNLNINYNKLNEVEKEKEKKEQDEITLMYKLIKNLYLCLDINNKRINIDKLAEIDVGEKMYDFFNNIFKYLNEKYDIRETEKDNEKNNEYNELYDEDNCFNDDEEENKNNIVTENDNIKKEEPLQVMDKETLKKFKNIELIKSICIRFIDEMCLENIKTPKIENSRNSIFPKGFVNSLSGRTTSATALFKSGSTCNLNNITRNTISKGDFYLNSNKNSSNKIESPIGAAFSQIFEFFSEFTISPYTFNSFFLIIFRNWPSREKIKFIKAINKEKINKFKLVIEKMKKVKDKDKLDLIKIIIQMIQRVGEEENNTFFMDKLDFFEYAYDQFNKFIFDMIEILDKTTEENKDEITSIAKALFCKHDYFINFYFALFDCLKTQRKRLGEVSVVGGRMQKTDESDKENKKKLDNIFKKIENDMKEIINKTLYNFVDVFYFRLLFSIYRNDYPNNEFYDFIFRIIQHIIEKLEEYEENNPFLIKKEIPDDKTHIKVGINNKNMLLLIYQIIFFNSRQKYLLKNEIFEQIIIIYLTNFLQKKQLIFLKIFFPIEEKEDPYNSNKNNNKQSQKKLIVEMLFEIFVSLYQSYKGVDNNDYLMFENLINDLFQGGRSSNFKNLRKKNSGKPPKTLCYEIDEYNFTKKYNEFSKSFYCYLKDLDPKEQNISVTILFLIKLTIYIKKLEAFEKSSSLIDYFIETSELLCKNAKTLYQTYSNYKLLITSGSNSTALYEDFTSFILNEYIINSVYNKELLISKTNKGYKQYINVDFTKDGKARLVSISSNINLLSNERKKNLYNNSNNFDEGSLGKSTREDLNENTRSNLRYNNKNYNSTNELGISKEKQRISIGIFNTKKEKRKPIYYKIIPKFLKSFLRTKFSNYFIKFLTYDEDFIKVKKIYNYLYHKEIDDINKYYLNYPSKLKNRLGNIYVKHFLKKDFNFCSSKYFQYSHKCIYDKKFKPSNQFLFPSKKILEEYDLVHEEIKDMIKNKKGKIENRSCELITYEGAIFGNIYVFENCFLFISDIKNDKRKIKDSFDYACCSMDFDFLEKDTTKVIEYSCIKNVFKRNFIYSEMSLEIFMKDGKSYLFNFFNDIVNSTMLDTLKSKNVKVIKNIKDYFDKKDYSRKWKEGKKSTYEYILILNKFSSRTYNDSNQYPLMPWTFMEDKRLRNFDIPMSIQDSEGKERFLKMPSDNEEKQNRWHSNHYSTSAYICYYLMRTNPFTDSMINFQSNSFDVPDRQFSDLKQTLILCEKNNNNREPVPELYTIPEVYINLNYNDFGVQTTNKMGRIHNVKFSPFAKNAYDFVYEFKYNLNNDEGINTKINMWFDFIFGVNQYNNDNKYGEGLRNFNKYCYAQNVNIKKIKENMRQKHKTDSEIYSEIKNILGLVISFGQCPFKILTYAHPKRTYTKGVHNTVLTSANKNKLNKEEQELNQAKEERIEDRREERVDEISEFFISYSADESMVQKDYDDNSRKSNIIYFSKSIFKNNLYCILNNKEIEVYQKGSWSKDYKFIKKINVSRNYLLFKKNKFDFPILKPEFLFCELKEEHFIFCRYLDNSIKLLMPNMEMQFLLESFVTCVIRINESEFVTGDDKGNISHWSINFDILNTKIKLIKKVKSNKNNITAMFYNKKLNIIIATDNNSIVIRSAYDFEFLTYIDIKDIKNEETIVDVKCSNYDYVYVLIYKDNNLKELRGYSLNGIYFGKIQEDITNFEVTKEGKILVNSASKGVINVLNPVNFKTIGYKFIVPNDAYFYHFYFEEPNIIFLGFKDKDGTKIKIIQLNKDEIKTFI